MYHWRKETPSQWYWLRRLYLKEYSFFLSKVYWIKMMHWSSSHCKHWPGYGMNIISWYKYNHTFNIVMKYYISKKFGELLWKNNLKRIRLSKQSISGFFQYYLEVYRLNIWWSMLWSRNETESKSILRLPW